MKLSTFFYFEACQVFVQREAECFGLKWYLDFSSFEFSFDVITLRFLHSLQARDLSLGYFLAATCYIIVGVVFFSAFPTRRSCISDVSFQVVTKSNAFFFN